MEHGDRGRKEAVAGDLGTRGTEGIEPVVRCRGNALFTDERFFLSDRCSKARICNSVK